MKNNKFNSQRTIAEQGINPAIAAMMSSDSNISYDEACVLANRKALEDLSQEENRIASILWKAALWQELTLLAHERGKLPDRKLEEILEGLDGRVMMVVESNLHKFIALCSKGKRECTFNAFVAWAHTLDKREEVKGLASFHKEINKACRRAWKTLPRSLKRGAKVQDGGVLYSSKEDYKEAVKQLRKTAEFLSKSGSFKLKNKAKAIMIDLAYMQGHITQGMVGLEAAQDLILGQRYIPTSK